MNADKIFKKKKRYSVIFNNAASELDDSRNVRLLAAVRIKEKNDKKVIIAAHTQLSTGIKLKDLKEETEYMIDNVASAVPLTHTHHVTDDGWTWHMYSDTQGIIFMMICANSYPARCAHKCIEEFQQKFSVRFGNGSTTAKENALTREFKSSFEALVLKYESPDDHDPATKALTKIGEVKNIMHDNIALSLQNTTSMETMSQSTEKLETQASVFKKSTVQMSKDLWWQSFRCTIIAGIMIFIALGCVAGGITYLVIQNNKRRKNQQDGDDGY